MQDARGKNLASCLLLPASYITVSDCIDDFALYTG